MKHGTGREGGRKGLAIAATVLLAAAIALNWLSFVDTIGLHGDEVFFGLQGADFLSGGVSSPYGMNSYTGALQGMMNAASFGLQGIDLVPLRTGGIACNLLALLLALGLLYRRSGPVATALFCFLLLQSVLLMCYPKVAWEVTSFNFLFLVLSLLPLSRADGGGRAGAFLFLLATLAGTYNHVIFSSFPAALVAGVGIRALFVGHSDARVQRILCLSALAMVNAVLLFGYMNLLLPAVWGWSPVLAAGLPLAVVALEVFTLPRALRLSSGLLDAWTGLRWPAYARWVLPGVAAFFFLVVHAMTVFQILANDVLLKRVFSYQADWPARIVFLLTATGLLGYVARRLYRALRERSTSLAPYVLVAYLGVLCAYTQEYSVRHFLLLMLLLFLWISVRLVSAAPRVRRAFFLLLAVNATMVQLLIWNVYLDEDRRVSAIKFPIGKNDTETSAHFIDYAPVVDYALRHRIGHLRTSEEFFIAGPFEFYRRARPELQDFRDTVTVEYDYGAAGNGFIIGE